MEYLISCISDVTIIHGMLDVAKTTPDGCFVEVGVYKGGTASYLTELAENQQRQIYLYDTFAGMPYQGELDPHPVGDFIDTDYESIKNHLPYANVVKGIFPDSAVDMPKIAFVHIDVDQYKAHIDSIDYLLPLMVKGGIMWFDDYTLPGANKAILEKFEESRIIRTPWESKVYVIV